jgi:hypothetical protein
MMMSDDEEVLDPAVIDEIAEEVDDDAVEGVEDEEVSE